LILEHEERRPRRKRRIAAIFVIGLVLAGLVVGWLQLPAIQNSSFMHHRDANAAIRALKDGDLDGVEKRLDANRGKPDFAYFFASQATPRALGDALGTVAGTKAGALVRHAGRLRLPRLETRDSRRVFAVQTAVTAAS
jgi:hypothetical protein